jgi:hypothetical protein
MRRQQVERTRVHKRVKDPDRLSYGEFEKKKLEQSERTTKAMEELAKASASVFSSGPSYPSFSIPQEPKLVNVHGNSDVFKLVSEVLLVLHGKTVSEASLALYLANTLLSSPSYSPQVPPTPNRLT